MCALMGVREQISCGMSLEMEKVCFLFAETTNIRGRIMYIYVCVCVSGCLRTQWNEIKNCLQKVKG